jgi:hypothetical protein
MPREVRLLILTAGLVLGGLFGTTVIVPDGGFQGAGGAVLPFGIVTIEIALGIIALGATITTIQRILHVRSQAIRSSTTPQAGVPARNGETDT